MVEFEDILNYDQIRSYFQLWSNSKIFCYISICCAGGDLQRKTTTQSMIAIITGDIVASRSEKAAVWLPVLEEAISQYSNSFDIFRGDSFQLELPVDSALVAAFYIKASMIEVGLDVRMGIGVGQKDPNNPSLKTNFGSALIYSGEAFEELKRETIYIKTADDDLDQLCNTILPLLTELSLRWTPNIATTIKAALRNKEINQAELAKLLNKKYQSQVSVALQKGAFAKIQQSIDYCTTKLLAL